MGWVCWLAVAVPEFFGQTSLFALGFEDRNVVYQSRDPLIREGMQLLSIRRYLRQQIESSLLLRTLHAEWLFSIDAGQDLLISVRNSKQFL